MDKPSNRAQYETLYLHVRQTEGSLLPSGVSITGNTKALVQLRKQIDRALEDVTDYPLDDAIYKELHGGEYEVLVTKARSREEMEGPTQPLGTSEAPEPQPRAESEKDERRRRVEG